MNKLRQFGGHYEVYQLASVRGAHLFWPSSLVMIRCYWTASCDSRTRSASSKGNHAKPWALGTELVASCNPVTIAVCVVAIKICMYVKWSSVLFVQIISDHDLHTMKRESRKLISTFMSLMISFNTKILFPYLGLESFNEMKTISRDSSNQLLLRIS